MAGDWLKFEKATPDKPEVFAIASELGIDPDAVVGKLVRVWSWFDTHTIDGNAKNVTLALLNRIAGVTDFAQAMEKVGWLIEDHQGVTMPKFDTHTGASAKNRAEVARRVAKLRSRAGCNGPVTNASEQCNGKNVTSALAREEKRRIDIPLPLSPDGATASPSLGGVGVKPKQSAPQSELGKRVAALFSRRPETAWAPKEISKFTDGVKRGVITAESIAVIEPYYAAERAKGEEGRHRRDLATFLNNFDGELDRANAAKTPTPAPKPITPESRSRLVTFDE